MALQLLLLDTKPKTLPSFQDIHQRLLTAAESNPLDEKMITPFVTETLKKLRHFSPNSKTILKNVSKTDIELQEATWTIKNLNRQVRKLWQKKKVPTPIAKELKAAKELLRNSKKEHIKNLSSALFNKTWHFLAKITINSKNAYKIEVELQKTAWIIRKLKKQAKEVWGKKGVPKHITERLKNSESYLKDTKRNLITHLSFNLFNRLQNFSTKSKVTPKNVYKMDLELQGAIRTVKKLKQQASKLWQNKRVPKRIAESLSSSEKLLESSKKLFSSKKLQEVLTKHRASNRIKALFRGRYDRKRVWLPSQLEPFIEKHLQEVLDLKTQKSIKQLSHSLAREIVKFNFSKKSIPRKTLALSKTYTYPILTLSTNFKGNRTGKVTYELEKSIWLTKKENSIAIQIIGPRLTRGGLQRYHDGPFHERLSKDQREKSPY